MKPKHYKAFAEGLNLFLKGHAQAIDFCMMMVRVADTWDDIIDGDNPSAEKINEAFVICLHSLYQNDFYTEFQNELRPIILSSVLKWIDANKLEAKQEHLEKSYMLRAGLYDLFAHCAYIVGGLDWYNEIGSEIRKFYGETFEDYRVEICQIQ